MTLTLFITLLSIMSVAVSIITEALKKYHDSMGIKRSSNAIVLHVAFLVGFFGTALVYLFMGIPFTAANIVCMPLMAIAVWVGAMVGYDKVVQMLEQIRVLK